MKEKGVSKRKKFLRLLLRGKTPVTGIPSQYRLSRKL